MPRLCCPPLQPNSRLLINYGIVDEDNPYDKLPLSSEQGQRAASQQAWVAPCSLLLFAV